MPCDGCGVELCKHGECECGDETCRQCFKDWNDRADAEREANFQRNVIGPMLGFDKEN